MRRKLIQELVKLHADGYLRFQAGLNQNVACFWFQPSLVTDANGNRAAYTFTPHLGRCSQFHAM